jgi:enolase-phosphatase E1
MKRPNYVCLFDIEGTTTSISFVIDTLFPFATKHIEAHLREHFDTLSEIIHEFREQAILDKKNGLENVVLVPLSGSEQIIKAVVSNAHDQISADRKLGCLKTIQGQIWLNGYRDGRLCGHIFDDVLPAFKRLKEQEVQICIYSSGSVQAQKLIFGYSIVGDLRAYISNYFDTKIGHKINHESYTKILSELNVEAGQVRFFTDKLSEAEAARQAGIEVIMMDRPGNPDQGPHSFEIWTDFTAL